MITPGGEEAFVSKMVTESITLGQRCRHVSSLGILPWFASRF
jgi:23S rRNA A1618 N6-methylase RlmF